MSATTLSASDILRLQQLGLLSGEGGAAPGTQVGFGTSNTLGGFLGAVGTGIGAVANPIGAILGAGYAASTGQPPSVSGLVGSALSNVGSALGVSGSPTADPSHPGKEDAMNGFGGAGPGSGAPSGGGSPAGPQLLATGGTVRKGVKGKGAPVFGIIRGAPPGVDTVSADLAEGSYVVPKRAVTTSAEIEKAHGKPGNAKGPSVNVRVSGGEYVLSPAQVEKAGGTEALDRKYGIRSTPKDAYAEGGGVMGAPVGVTGTTDGGGGGSADATPTGGPSVAPVGPSGGAPVAAASQGALGGDVVGFLKQQIGGVEEARKDLGDMLKKRMSSIEETKSMMATPPAQQQTNPITAFGSAATFLATMGSLMTRRHMINVVNASADVMDAYKKNDVEATQQAFQLWRTKLSEAIQIQQMENDAYQAAINGKKEDLALAAVAFKDQAILHMAENGQREAAIDLITGRVRQTTAMGSRADELSWKNTLRTANTEIAKLRAAGDNEGADAKQAALLKQAELDPYGVQWLQDYHKATGTGPSRVAGNPNAIMLSKFMADHPDATAEQLRDFSISMKDDPNKERKDKEIARHNAVVEELAGQRFQSEDDRRRAMSAETERHNIEMESLGERRADLGDKTLEWRQTATKNREEIDNQKLDLARLTQSQRNDIESGRLDLAKLSEADRKAIGWANLDFKAIAETNRKEVADKRLDLSKLSFDLRDRIESGRLALSELSEADKKALGWANLDMRAISETNRKEASDKRLDLSRLTEEHRNAIAEGRVDIAKMSAQDLAAYRAGTLDLNSWVKRAMVEQGDRRLDLQEGRDKDVANHRRALEDQAANKTPSLSGLKAAEVLKLEKVGLPFDKALAQAEGRGEQHPLSPEAVDLNANIMLMTGQMPSLGLSGQGSAGAARLQILNRFSELAKERGLNADDIVAGRALVKADSGSLTALTRMTDAAVSFEATALKNMQIVENLMDKGAGTSLGPIVNRWLQAGKRETGDPDVAAFNSAMWTAATEYAKVMSGSTGSQASTDSARLEANRMLNTIDSPAAIRAVIEKTMKPDMENRKNALAEQRQTIIGRISRGDLQSPPLIGTGGGTPSGAVRHNVGDIIKQGGKNYRATQVDANGKVIAADEVP